MLRRVLSGGRVLLFFQQIFLMWPSMISSVKGKTKISLKPSRMLFFLFDLSGGSAQRFVAFIMPPGSKRGEAMRQ